MTRLLSVDWDFFFPVPEVDAEFLYDWGHREDLALMKEEIWVFRAADFLQRGKPLPDTDGRECDFWSRFRFNPDAKLYYADSHSQIFKPEVFEDGVTEIWSFDAHHDAFKTPKEVIRTNQVTCESWAVAAWLNKAKVRVFYPPWREYALKEEKPKVPIHIELDPQNRKPFRQPFDKVFVCRSGAWTPTWLEDKFWEFIFSCPALEKVNLDGIKRREYPQEEADKLAKAEKKVIEEVIQ